MYDHGTTTHEMEWCCGLLGRPRYCTVAGQYAMVMPPLRGDAQDTRARDVSLCQGTGAAFLSSRGSRVRPYRRTR